MPQQFDAMNNADDIQGPDVKDMPSLVVQEASESQESQGVQGATRPAVSRGASHSQSQWHESHSGGVRNIEVHQNWLAKLFRFKPAIRHLCMVTGRKRGRQEIAILLREWRKYGIKGLQVDKQRNIVFARVVAKNCKCRVSFRSICS